MSRVMEALEAWRQAERELAATTDADEVECLVLEVSRLHDAYRREVERESNQPMRDLAPGDP